ncbi:MAG: T9SS type A sorting domain-containing protein, partial [Chitinophagaceae bacterium]
PAFSTNTTYSNPPTSMGHLDYYNRILSKGYHIGPFMDHDTHYTNFGRSNNNRLAVVAPSLSSTDFFAAMKSRSFYATEDCDTRVNFKLNNASIGSINSGINPPAISLYAIDPTSPSSVPNIKIMYGIAGSGLSPVQVANANSYSLAFTDNSLINGAEAYYYADITIAGNRTITAPIWYTKVSNVPVKLLNFDATLTTNRTVKIEWKTTNEVDNKMFVVEKSFDGVSFSILQNVDSKNSTAVNNYEIIDAKPNEGVNYYRLKQIDLNGKYTYSNVIAINIETYENNSFSIYPNPTFDMVQLNINSTAKSKASIAIFDVTGREIKFVNVDVVKGFQTQQLFTNQLKQGSYYIKMNINNQTITQKLIKL